MMPQRQMRIAESALTVSREDQQIRVQLACDVCDAQRRPSLRELALHLPRAGAALLQLGSDSVQILFGLAPNDTTRADTDNKARCRNSTRRRANAPRWPRSVISSWVS